MPMTDDERQRRLRELHDAMIANRRSPPRD